MGICETVLLFSLYHTSKAKTAHMSYILVLVPVLTNSARILHIKVKMNLTDFLSVSWSDLALENFKDLKTQNQPHIAFRDKLMPWAS